MTQRHDLAHHLASLGDIKNIMNSLKTLAYIESQKLNRFLKAQLRVVSNIEQAAMDLISFYPELLPKSQKKMTAYLVIGSERGFCGNFNQALIKQLKISLSGDLKDHKFFIFVGTKLSTALEGYTNFSPPLVGANVVEEVSGLLNNILDRINLLESEHGAVELKGIFHTPDQGIIEKIFLPPFQTKPQPSISFSYPPLSNLPRENLFLHLAEQYLFAALHEMLYTSLMAENHYRVKHLEGAIKHLDEESERLAKKYNALRQEEIVQEMEIILLSTLPSKENKPKT